MMNIIQPWLMENKLSVRELEAGFAFYNDSVISRAMFLQHIAAACRNIPDSEYVINLCEDRYLFMVAFIACLCKKQISLLPPNRLELEIKNLKLKYKNCSCISDKDIVLQETEKPSQRLLLPEVDIEQIACIVFTSGSTGQPKANEKKWGELLASSKKVAEVLGLERHQQYHFIATVPAQHMFGFEMSIMLPLVTGALIHSMRPFFPQEVNLCLSRVAAPRILITTPMHLRACVEAGLDWPEIEFVLSATATLEDDLAHKSEISLKTRVKEIYGCSEAGAIASREPTVSALWELFPGYRINNTNSVFELSLPGIDNTTILHDNFEFNANEQFELLGRDTDMIKVAGKRGSLGDLQKKMCSIPGVEEAVFFMPHTDAVKGRTAALVVAKELESEQIIKALAEKVDPVFLPRPLIKVDHIPYNEIGKISRTKLLEIFRQNKKQHENLSSCAGK